MKKLALPAYIFLVILSSSIYAMEAPSSGAMELDLFGDLDRAFDACYSNEISRKLASAEKAAKNNNFEKAFCFIRQAKVIEETRITEAMVQFKACHIILFLTLLVHAYQCIEADEIRLAIEYIDGANGLYEKFFCDVEECSHYLAEIKIKVMQKDCFQEKIRTVLGATGQKGTGSLDLEISGVSWNVTIVKDSTGSGDRYLKKIKCAYFFLQEAVQNNQLPFVIFNKIKPIIVNMFHDEMTDEFFRETIGALLSAKKGITQFINASQSISAEVHEKILSAIDVIIFMMHAKHMKTQEAPNSDFLARAWVDKANDSIKKITQL